MSKDNPDIEKAFREAMRAEVGRIADISQTVSPREFVIDTVLGVAKIHAYNVLGISSCNPLTVKYIPGYLTWEIATVHESIGYYRRNNWKHLGIIYVNSEDRYEVWARQVNPDGHSAMLDEVRESGEEIRQAVLDEAILKLAQRLIHLEDLGIFVDKKTVQAYEEAIKILKGMKNGD